MADLRPVLFFAWVAVLAGALALLLADRQESSAPALSAGPRTSQPADHIPARQPADLRTAARGFLAAYMAVDAGDRRAAATLRASSTASLARRILASAPPRPRGGIAQPAISGLTVARLPDRPYLAIATGTALRTSGPEPLAFLFARRRGRWLAIAPAE